MPSALSSPRGGRIEGRQSTGGSLGSMLPGRAIFAAMPAARPSPHALIVTPAAADSRAGNRATARRWAALLRRLGWRATIRGEWDGREHGLLVALHAAKSHDSVAAFRRAHPARPVVVALTGTDLYRDRPDDVRVDASLALADRIVVLQEEARAALPAGLRRKTAVIHQSFSTRLAHAPSARGFRVCVLGHLRPEKAPFLVAEALRARPGLAIEAVHAGRALSPEMAAQARRAMRAEPRYRWVGEWPRWRALRLLARSRLMVISSVMEGGANVVSEAIRIGVPVLASDIPGNRGLLGAAYPGYFPRGDADALGALLARAQNEPAFLARLAAAVRRRQPLFAPERELAAWRRLLAELC